MSTAEKYKLLGRPRKARALVQNDLVLGELVAPANFPPKILNSDIYLCDFGILIESGTSVSNKLQSPPGYCAPELFHNFEPSFASDMWSYIVVFLRLYAGHPVFYGPGFAGKLGSIVNRVGMLPPEWKGRYAAYDKGDVQASWYGNGSQSKDFLSEFLDQHRPDISAREKAHALSVIRQVFRPRPEERIGAAGLLENEDFKALMRLYGI
jgi:serine/threonine protein kinase